ncbi:uncharacterized protein LOC123290789 [Chrysoperla carnea]|uniref:uncharacterized protein LOC123290789 n=1 Tax=Chrysoperla carnea TaxID=189513 RepID=UPI001D07BC9C|nr:uncharacterized protein LOC123290789 [Chrysoperla carnea]
MEIGQIKSEISEEVSNDIDNVPNVKREPVKNIKLEKELHTELIVKNEILDDNLAIEVVRIKNEIPEEDTNNSDNVISVKHEPVHDNDKQLYTINDENIKVKKELHTESNLAIHKLTLVIVIFNVASEDSITVTIGRW